jgi:TonB family protein
MQGSSTLNPKTISVFLFVLIAISFAGAGTTHGQAIAPPGHDLKRLEAKFETQYDAIEYLYAHGPAKRVFPPDPKQRLAQWQKELADSFAQAGTTIDEILKLHPADDGHWRELRETMWLYSQPVSPPESRAVFGASEVQTKARLLDAAAADYPDEAGPAKVNGEVRLTLVLAADGTVKDIFPMKPLPHGLTEAAINAARQIKFTPAVRNGQTVSQFAILSYEFKNGRGLPPYTPDHVFYF